MTSPRQVTREQRDALYRATRAGLRRLGYIVELVEAGRLETARMLRVRYEAQLRLLDDLGWAPDDPRERFALTISDALLARTLLRLVNSTILDAANDDVGSVSAASTRTTTLGCRRTSTAWSSTFVAFGLRGTDAVFTEVQHIRSAG